MPAHPAAAMTALLPIAGACRNASFEPMPRIVAALTLCSANCANAASLIRARAVRSSG